MDYLPAKPTLRNGCVKQTWFLCENQSQEIGHELEKIGEYLSTSVLITMRDGYVMRLIPPRVGLPSVWSVPGLNQRIALDLWIWLDRYLCERCNVVAFPRCTEEGTSWPCFPCLCRPEMVQSVEHGLRWGGARLDMLPVMWLEEWVWLWCLQCCCVTRCAWCQEQLVWWIAMLTQTKCVGVIQDWIKPKIYFMNWIWFHGCKGCSFVK